MMNLNKKKEVRRNKLLAKMKIMNTDIPRENVEIIEDNWNTDLPGENIEIIDVLENNKNFKKLLLYALRTLNNDVKQEIVKKLTNQEILYCYIFLD